MSIMSFRQSNQTFAHSSVNELSTLKNKVHPDSVYAHYFGIFSQHRKKLFSTTNPIAKASQKNNLFFMVLLTPSSHDTFPLIYSIFLSNFLIQFLYSNIKLKLFEFHCCILIFRQISVFHAKFCIPLLLLAQYVHSQQLLSN